MDWHEHREREGEVKVEGLIGRDVKGQGGQCP